MTGEAHLDVLWPVGAGAEPERLVAVPVPGADDLTGALQDDRALHRPLVFHGLAEGEHHRHADPVGDVVPLEDLDARGGVRREGTEAAHPGDGPAVGVDRRGADHVLGVRGERPAAAPGGRRRVELAGDGVVAGTRGHRDEGPVAHGDRDATLRLRPAQPVRRGDGDAGRRDGGARAGAGLAGRPRRGSGTGRGHEGEAERGRNNDDRGDAPAAAGAAAHAMRLTRGIHP